MKSRALCFARFARLFAALLSLALLMGGCSGMFFYPAKEMEDISYLRGLSQKEIKVSAPDGVELRGLLVKDRPGPLGTIVYFHGNAENISTHLRSVEWLARLGYQILAVDYRGYGLSGSEPTIEGVNADALAILDYAFACPDIDPERVAVFGQSLGGALAIRAVAVSENRPKVRFLASESAFFGYREIVRDKIAATIIGWPFSYPLSLGVEDDLSPGRFVGAISPVPFLVIHSEHDPVVPYSHAKKLFEGAKEPKGFWTVRGSGHGSGFAVAELRENFVRVLRENLPEKK